MAVTKDLRPDAARAAREHKYPCFSRQEFARRFFVPVVVLSLLGITLVQGLRWLEIRVAPWQQIRED